MEFLKEILGEELFEQVAEKINAHNGNEANKDNQIKVGNLGTGEYVSNDKYKALQDLIGGKDAEIANANKLIGELQKGTKGNEELQGKIQTYEAEKAELQAQLQETKLKSAIKVGLLAEKCADVDYVTFKLMESLKEKGETLELDENDNIKGWNDRISGLKTQLPTQFESASAGKKVIVDGKLPTGDEEGKTVTKEEFAKMGYSSRVELRKNNPELYQTLTK